MPVLLLEGVCGAGKTTLLRSLEDRGGGVVTGFGQDMTYQPVAPHEDANTLDDALNLKLLDGVVDQIEIASRGNRTVVVDTLHVTQSVRPGILSRRSFGIVETRLKVLSTRIMLLTISKDEIRRRTVEGRRGSGFYRYISRFAAGEDELVNYLHYEQESLRNRLSRWSILPWREESGEQQAEHLVRRVLGFG